MDKGLNEKDENAGKRCSASLLTGEIKIKALRYHFTSTFMVIIFKKRNKCWHDVEKLETLCTAGGNVKWRSHIEDSSMVPQKSKHRIIKDLAISPLKESKTGLQTDSYNPIFTAAVVTIAKRWK